MDSRRWAIAVMTFLSPVFAVAQDGDLLDVLPSVKAVQLGPKPFTIDAISTFEHEHDKRAKITTVILKTSLSNHRVECVYAFEETQSEQLDEALTSASGLSIRGADRDKRIWKKSEFFDVDPRATASLKLRPGLSMRVDPQSIEHFSQTNTDCKGKHITVGKRSFCDSQGTTPVSHSWFVKFKILIGNLHLKFDCSDQFAPLESQGLPWADFVEAVGTDFEFDKS